MSINDNFVSAREAAKILNITTARVGVLCRAGRFKGAEKLDLGWIIPREAVLNHKRLPPGTKPKSFKQNDIQHVQEMIKQLSK